MFFKNSFQHTLMLVCWVLLSFELYSQGKTQGLIQKLSGNDENGFVLFSPIGVDTTYLIDKCGKRIHTWHTDYTPGLSVYLKPNGNLLKTGTYYDTSFGISGGRGGVIEEYDWNGNKVWEYVIFNDSLCQHHDIHPMPNGNVLVLAWHSISKSKALSLGRRQPNFGQINELWGERIIELKPLGMDSAEIVWQWDLFDHLVQNVDTAMPAYGEPEDHPELMDINYAIDIRNNDWIHANGIDYNQKLDQIVISTHNICEFWIIDHSTTAAEAKSHTGGNSGKGGDILYRWGNPEAYAKGTIADRKFFQQHNARWIPGGYRDSGKIMVFNNGLGRDTLYSSIDVVQTPVFGSGYVGVLPYLPANASWSYRDSVPVNFYSPIISGAQMLPNGNVMICNGIQGKFFEITPEGKTVWEYKNPVGPNEVISDGTTGKQHSVFRSEFYPSDYPAFKNKDMGQKGVLEQASKPYTCTPEKIKPLVVNFRPSVADSNVLPGAFLDIIFSENVLKNKGAISIYGNGVNLENIDIGGYQTTINGNKLRIDPNRDFPVNSRIAIRIPASLVRDSSFNELSAGIDTGQWYFYTVKSKPLMQKRFPEHLSVNHKAGTILHLRLNETVFKDKGSIYLYENGTLIESINVNASNVVVMGKDIYITPSKLLNSDKLIVVEMDACFKSVYGISTQPVVYGDWYFRTAKAPQIRELNPLVAAQNIGLKPVIKLVLDKNVTVDSAKDVWIYENNLLKHTFSINDGNVTVDSNSVSIEVFTTFLNHTRIAVRFPGNVLKDTSGFYFSGIDSGDWYFNTERKVSVDNVNHVDLFEVFPNPVSERLTIVLPEPMQSLEIVDLSGRSLPYELVEGDNKAWVISLAQLNTGVYLIRVNSLYTAVINVN